MKFLDKINKDDIIFGIVGLILGGGIGMKIEERKTKEAFRLRNAIDKEIDEKYAGEKAFLNSEISRMRHEINTLYTKLEAQEIAEHNDYISKDDNMDNKTTSSERKIVTRSMVEQASYKIDDPEFDEHFEEVFGPVEDDDLVEEDEEEEDIRVLDDDKEIDSMIKMYSDIGGLATITYYSMNDVYIDENGCPFSPNTVIKMFGVYGCEKIEGCTADTQVYIENKLLDTLFEVIVKTDEDFYKDVMNV